MRYLPAINLADGIWQIALPDVHSIALVESIWISDKSERQNAISNILLNSPPLLYWVCAQFAESSESSNKPLSGFSGFELDKLNSGATDKKYSTDGQRRNSAEYFTGIGNPTQD